MTLAYKAQVLAEEASPDAAWQHVALLQRSAKGKAPPAPAPAPLADGAAGAPENAAPPPPPPPPPQLPGGTQMPASLAALLKQAAPQGSAWGTHR